MPDRKKVIEALECCLDIVKSGRLASGCISCPYAEKKSNCREKMIRDAIELLKEQGAKPPMVHENAYGRKFYYCPKCNRTFDFSQRLARLVVLARKSRKWIKIDTRGAVLLIYYCIGGIRGRPDPAFFIPQEGASCTSSRRGAALTRRENSSADEVGSVAVDYQSKRHREWREKVLRRAGYLCEECKRYGRKTPATTAHHIKHADAYPELRYVLTNGRALCEACHNKAHPEKGGKAWRSE